MRLSFSSMRKTSAKLSNLPIRLTFSLPWLRPAEKEIKAQRNELETVTKVMRMFEATPRAEGNRLFRRGTLPRLIFDALRANPEGLDAHQLAAFIIE